MAPSYPNDPFPPPPSIKQKFSSLQYLYNHQSTSVYTPHSSHIITSMPIYVFILLKYTYIIKTYILLKKLQKYSLILRALTGLPGRAAPSVTIILGHVHFTT